MSTKYCNPIQYHIVSISCRFKPLIDDNTNGNTLFMKIISIVCKYSKVTALQLQSSSRKTNIVEARHLAIYFLYNYAKNTTTVSLGRYFNRDHSTIVNSLKVVERFNGVDRVFKTQYNSLKRKILKFKNN